MNLSWPRSLLVVELVVCTLVWLLILIPIIQVVGAHPLLFMEYGSAFDRGALAIAAIAYWPVLFLSFGYLRTPPDEFGFEFDGPWVVAIAAVALVAALTLWSFIASPGSGYSRALLLQFALVLIPTIHLVAVALCRRLANNALEPAARQLLQRAAGAREESAPAARSDRRRAAAQRES